MIIYTFQYKGGDSIIVLKRRILTALAITSFSVLIIAGTYAWSNINSQHVNEWFTTKATPVGKPGGTLHDDNKDGAAYKEVYAENWGDQDLFVRIRLYEYMEIGLGAGLKSVATDASTGECVHNPDNLAKPLISGADIDRLDTWKVHIPDNTSADICDTEANFHNYWKWQMGGQKYYFPAPEGAREIKGYVDTNSPAGLTEISLNSDGRKAKLTPFAQVMTMAEWISAGSPIGYYWVIDTDGWAYWAAPVKPGESTGLLLSKIVVNEPPEQDYYYAVNVIAQMSTKDGIDANGNMDNYSSFGLAANSGWTPNGKALMDLVTGTSADIPPVYSTIPPVTSTPEVTIAPAPATPDTPAPAAPDTPAVTNAPASNIVPTPVPSVTIAPGVIPPSVSVSNATVIGDIIYAKTGQAIEFTASSSSSFRVGFLSINGALLDESGAYDDNEYYTITVPINGDYLKSRLVVKETVKTGAKIPIVALAVNASMITNPNRDNYYIDNSKNIRIIPGDSADAVKGNDGKVYIKYYNGVYREFQDDGELGPVINALP